MGWVGLVGELSAVRLEGGWLSWSRGACWQLYSELPPAVASWQPYKRLVELSALVSGNLAAA